MLSPNEKLVLLIIENPDLMKFVESWLEDPGTFALDLQEYSEDDQ